MADKRISQLVERTDIANNDVVPIVASGASTTNKATISSIQTYMQENLDVGVTSVGITLGSSGTDVNVTGSPITTSGNITINIPTASATNRGLLSSADWSTFNGKQNSITLTTTGTSGPSTLIGSTLNIPSYSTDLSGYVTLGTAQTITAQKTFTTSGSSDTMIISHGSGSGFALDVIKAGSGEAIRVNKTSGSGNAMTIIGGNFEAPTIVKTGGTSAQFLKADGSVDSNTYVTTDTNQSITGFKSFSNGFSLATAGGTNQATTIKNIGTIHEGSASTNQIGFNNSNNIYFGKGLSNGGVIQWTNTAVRYYTLPDADGTLALASQLGAYLPLAGGTLTGALNGTSAVFSGDLQSGTRLIAAASSQSILLTPNSGGTTNRVESVGTLPLALVSAAAITMAAGGTTPQITLATSGGVTLTGALGGTSASFTGNVTTNGEFNVNPSSGDGILRMFTASTERAAVRANATKFFIEVGTFGERLSINNSSGLLSYTGAATFSSSVTATRLTASNSTDLLLNLERTAVGAWGFNVTSGGNLFLNNRFGTNVFHIADLGNVGIGTASPAYSLDVNGSTNVSSTNFYRYNGDTGIIGSGSAITGGSSTQLGIRAASDILFATNGANERMRITSGGNVLIGHTSTTYSEKALIQYAGGDNQGLHINQTGSTAANDKILFSNGNGIVGYIRTDGSATSYVTASDYRLKEDLQEINGLEKVSALKVYDFKWINSEDRTDGVLAHELAEVLPYAVTGEKDGEQMQGVDYSKIVPILIKAIQELKAEIDSLKTK